MELLLYTERASPRFRYVAEILFRHLLPCSYRLTTDAGEWLRHQGPRLQYGGRRLHASAVFIPAGALLQETGLHSLSPTVFRYDGLPAFFREETPDTDFPFDLPAVFFYLLSRYEEYLPFRPDEHGRFPATQSLAFREGFLEQPLINQWSRRLEQSLMRRFPAWKPAPAVYSFQPTYDVDLAWAYRHRGLLRQAGGALRDGWAGRRRELLRRVQVLLGRCHDPFFTFDELDRLHDRFQLRPRYFFLLADPGPYDRNIRPDHPAMVALIRSLDRRYELGIHPSYRSNSEERALRQEIGRLQAITGRPVYAGRQHYLKVHLPTTYRRLLAAGLRTDYSMGYADRPGFRAGIATPFPWYDLERETSTELMLHPFQVMDVTLKNYLGLTPQEAKAFLPPLIEPIRQCGGTFTTLWHNSSFSPIDGWDGWREVYEQLIAGAVMG